ncbi:MAG TPA: hypothetical protein PK864_09235 [Syntrophorhabdaceae bacterium]|nr:hypothetical protein [Syntrophorhabdaceae bacterium]HOL05932.1 hypothetical protein [Syntrophorhabdaceae bacterium]HON86188.1 hypothetical protein [Syntrophorhabdaceae bacterium]HOT42512.1 hypothetical protein [Syntrophorhabdaceae bacterium]HPC67611.1 hypothetical protein [Syntrophorhabdaceae bacterium]
MRLIIFLTMILFFLPAHVFSQQKETCVGCHTSEKTLKMLYKPVKIESSEGEG